MKYRTDQGIIDLLLVAPVDVTPTAAAKAACRLADTVARVDHAQTTPSQPQIRRPYEAPTSVTLWS